MKKDNLREALYELNTEEMETKEKMNFSGQDMEKADVSSLFGKERKVGSQKSFRRFAVAAAVLILCVLSIGLTYGDKVAHIFVKRKDYETVSVYLSRNGREKKDKKDNIEDRYSYLPDTFRKIYAFEEKDYVHIQFKDMKSNEIVDFYDLSSDTVFEIRNYTRNDDFEEKKVGISNVIVAKTEVGNIYIWEQKNRIHYFETSENYDTDEMMEHITRIIEKGV